MVKTSIIHRILRRICERIFIFLRTLEKTSEIVNSNIEIKNKNHGQNKVVNYNCGNYELGCLGQKS